MYEVDLPLIPRAKPMPPYTPQQIDYFTDLAEELQRLIDEDTVLKDGLDE